MPPLLRMLAYLWVSPATLLGLAMGGVCWLCGGRVRRHGPIVEFHGRPVAWLLRRFAGNAAAMTLGHVVVGRTLADLDAAYEHELVHVRQYERWGPLFIPLYLAASAWLWLRGRSPYWDNPWEREAYRQAW